MSGQNDQSLRDQHLMSSYKADREHYDRNINCLLEQFNEEGAYTDTLKLFGSKYNERMREFQQLKADNNKLKLQTRQLQYQLSQFRNSLQDSAWKQEDIMNKLSIQKSKTESPFNNVSIEQHSTREQMKSKLEQLDKMKAEAKKQYDQHFQDYDQLLKEMFKFLQLTSNTKNLLSEMKSVANDSTQKNEQSEMVLVPRKRYQLLIELYAQNMAENSARALVKRVEQDKSKVQALIDNENKQERQKQKYTNIVQNSTISDLQTFFHRLAEKFGFEKEWERYHLENQKQAIALKGKIDSIINPKNFESSSKKNVSGQQKLQKEQKQEFTKDQFTKKIDSLVKIVSFSSKEKQYWSQIYHNIHYDKLFSVDKIVGIMKKVDKDIKGDMIAQFSQLLHLTISTYLEKLDELLLPKYRRGMIANQQLMEKYKQEHIIDSIKAMLAQKPNAESLQLAKIYSKQALQQLFGRLKKQVISASNRSIYSALPRNQ